MSAEINPSVLPSGTDCVECDAAGGWWLHLRRCAACGHIGCCDDSLARHARAHWQKTGHPIIRSFEPDEGWFWDFAANHSVEGPTLAGPECRPVDQPSPGRVGECLMTGPSSCGIATPEWQHGGRETATQRATFNVSHVMTVLT
jgi:hypothetical protein